MRRSEFLQAWPGNSEGGGPARGNAPFRIGYEKIGTAVQLPTLVPRFA